MDRIGCNVREPLNPILKLARVRSGVFASKDGFGVNGVFVFRGPEHRYLRAIASDRRGWEHVSVTVQAMREETPTWREMQYVKELFWTDDEVVMQLHPAKENYINDHPGCLHLWRPVGADIPLPPLDLI